MICIHGLIRSCYHYFELENNLQHSHGIKFQVNIFITRVNKHITEVCF